MEQQTAEAKAKEAARSKQLQDRREALRLGAEVSELVCTYLSTDVSISVCRSVSQQLMQTHTNCCLDELQHTEKMQRECVCLHRACNGVRWTWNVC